MARKYTAGVFTNGMGNISLVDNTEEFGLLHDDIADGLSSLKESVNEQLEEQTATFEDYLSKFGDRFDDDLEQYTSRLDENLLVMKEISRQLDVLTELVGEISEKLGAGI
ncbi:MAG: hypothetical protein IKX83_04945 [Clostridia bacterium]|nr:hypothetical protein [Clostridia bacterium]